MDGMFSADAPHSAAAEAGETRVAVAAVGQRRFKALIVSRLPEKQTYSTVEGGITRKGFNLSLTWVEAFKALAPQLMRAQRRVGVMTLEQVGVVSHAHAPPAILDPRFNQTIFLEDEEDLEEALNAHVSNATGGVLFRVVMQPPPPSKLPKQNISQWMHTYWRCSFFFILFPSLFRGLAPRR
jgi:hypothetical protein